MAGPNGSGKSSLFDAFKTWHSFYGAGGDRDPLYHQKRGLPTIDWSQYVTIDFHGELPADPEQRKKLFYIRSAYRNQADFTLSSLTKIGSALDAPKVLKLIDIDASVADNYQRLVSHSVERLFVHADEDMSVRELRDDLIGQLRASMLRVFGGLRLQSLGNPLQDGTFFFEKGVSQDFHYKNLSGGEKAAFDLLLDLVVKRSAYDNTVYCIDEPELHMNTRLQADLLEETLRLIPDNCQLWVATHSIGMMRRARDLQAASPDSVVFLDFESADFDEPAVLRPAHVDRQFWTRTLSVALDDLATLVAPRRVVLCEGRPAVLQSAQKSELDAHCYRLIFSGDYPDTDFMSVGSENDVRTDKLGLGQAIQALVKGTTVLRLVDQDDRNPREIEELRAEGVRVLSRRHLEAFLMDDEVLEALCISVGQPNKIAEVVEAKAQAMNESVNRGNPRDDIKSASGKTYTEIKRILQLTQCGNTVNAFLRDTLAPLLRPGMATYAQLKRDIFDE